MKKFLVIFITIVIIEVVFGINEAKQSFLGLGQKPICVNGGDYCKDNTDCCSKKCASNKCMNADTMAVNTNNVNLLEQTTKPTQEIDNRFNEDTQKKCQATGSKCSSSLKCCDFLSCENNICRDRSVYVNGTETLGYNKTAELDNRFNENESESATTVNPAKCKELGDKCFLPADCCTPYKCHSFLHQCVT